MAATFTKTALSTASWTPGAEVHSGFQTWNDVVITWDEWIEKWGDGYTFVNESSQPSYTLGVKPPNLV